MKNLTEKEIQDFIKNNHRFLYAEDVLTVWKEKGITEEQEKEVNKVEKEKGTNIQPIDIMLIWEKYGLTKEDLVKICDLINVRIEMDFDNQTEGVSKRY